MTHILALNAGHRFHHLKWAGLGDVNFGLSTLLWDHLLDTYSHDPGRRFSGAALGMAAKPDHPVGYLAQLTEPFTRRGGCEVTADATPDKTSETTATVRGAVAGPPTS